MLRVLDAGESHGPALTAIIEGFPAGVHLNRDRINQMLALRQQGYGRGNRQKIEKDEIEVLSGLRKGVTLGSPLTLRIINRDWMNWRESMSPWGSSAGENDAPDDPAVSDTGRSKKIVRPRPGHADLVGYLKYGFDDVRNALERASARSTAIRTAVGAVCYEFLMNLGVHGVGFVTEVGSVSSQKKNCSVSMLEKAISNSELRCADPVAEKKMIKLIEICKKEGDSLGGVIEVWFDGLVPGLGAYAHWDRKLDGKLAQALMSVQAIKGVEVGLGFDYARSRGSKSHDEIVLKKNAIARKTNNSGGLEAGVTNGERLVVRAGMKPLPTLVKPIGSVNLVTKKTEKATVERTDVCAIAAASIVGFSVVSTVLTDAYLEKFGGDHLGDIQEALKNYSKRVGKVLHAK